MTDLHDDKTQQFPHLSELSVELFELYARLVKLQKQRVRISAEIDNVRELIRQKG